MDERGRRATRVLVVSDDPLARGGLAALLASQGLEVAGQADLDGAAAMAATLGVEVAVVDPGLDAAPTVVRELTDDGVAVLVLAAAAGAAALWATGARGVLPRDTRGPRLATAVEALAAGLAVMDPDTMPTRAARAADLVEELTPRELEVLQLLAQGLPNRAIADRLGIALRTAKFHVNAILAKLGAANRTEAIVQAHRLGLVVL